jgi:hypothetical protein
LENNLSDIGHSTRRNKYETNYGSD